MNWNKFQTYGLSSEKSFEMLCNQLFENWCKEEYGSKGFSFCVVNGAGGDGGVESYAELTDGSFVGLQAKWFLSSIESKHISQIRNSVRTSKEVRSQITRYIVCVPRDLASHTAKSDNTERRRWDDFVQEMNSEYPGLLIELWDDSRILFEMQKSSSTGIQKYWFENSEIEFDKIKYSFESAKHSWLSAKYVPDLNVTGKIKTQLENYIGSIETRLSLL